MNKQLEARLEDLRGELRDAGGVEVPERARIERLIGEIQSILDASTSEESSASSISDTREAAAEPATLGDRLRDSTLQFEGEHPRLTAAVEQVIDMLGKMGI